MRKIVVLRIIIGIMINNKKKIRIHNRKIHFLYDLRNNIKNICTHNNVINSKIVLIAYLSLSL